jgi:hypothetical protein
MKVLINDNKKMYFSTEAGLDVRITYHFIRY